MPAEVGSSSDAVSAAPWVVLTSCIGYALVMVDTTVVNVTLPTLARDLHAGVSGLQWVVDGYTLVFAVCLLSGGALGDRLGAKRVFIGGFGLFVAASLVCGLAGSIPLLVAGRLLQGLGAATAVPASLVLVQASLTDRTARARAVGMWGATAGIAAGIGPVIGGVLVDAWGWRSAFFVNVPVGVVCVVLAIRTLPSPARRPHPLDLPGQASAVVCLAALAVALIEGGAHGWAAPVVIAGFATFVVASAVFVTVERRSPSPLLPGGLFASKTFSTALAVGVCGNFGFFGELFVMTLYLQQVRGRSALVAGLFLVPQMAASVAGSALAGRLMSRVGLRAPMLVGWLIGGAGMLGLVATTAHSSYWALFPCVMAAGFGISLAMMAATAAVMEDAPPEKGGVASGAVNACRQVGGMIGVAFLGSLVASNQPFLPGMHVAMAIAGGAFVVALGLTARFIVPRPAPA